MPTLIKTILLTIITILTLTSCSGGESGGTGAALGVDIVVVDGYIRDAHIIDSNNNIAKYKSNGVYTFTPVPIGEITVSGGYFEDTGLPNKMIFKVSSSSRVVSPITSFLYQYPHLQQKILTALGITSNELLGDFVKSNKIDVAKLAQIIYSMNVNTLEDDFANTLTNDIDLTGIDDIFTQAKTVVTADAPVKETEIQAFLDAVKVYTGSASEFEISIGILKEKSYESKEINDNSTFLNITATFKNVLTTNLNILKSLDLSQVGGISYNIPNLPSWATIDKQSGKLSVIPTDIGHELYDIEIIYENKTAYRYKNALRISVYPKADSFQAYIDTLIPEAPISIADAPSTIIHTGPQFIHNPDKTSWTVCLPYYAAYTSYQQIMTVDLSSGTLKVNDTTSVHNASWHMFKTVPGPGSKTFIAAQGIDSTRTLGGGFAHLHMYDSATHKFTFDIMPIREDHRNATQRPKLVAGTNGKIYSYATMEASSKKPKSVVEFDPDTNTTRFWGDIPSGGDVHAIAVDNDYIYTTDNPYGERILTSINLETGEMKQLSKGPVYQLYQRKYGVVLSLSSTWYWLYNGEIIVAPRGKLNTSPPWGFDDTDLYKHSEPNLSVAELATKPHSLDETALIPTGSSTTGTLWYKDSNSGDTYISVDFPNVVKHKTSIKRLRGLPNGKIFGATYGYSGYALFDVNTDSVEHYLPLEGRLSNYGICTKDSDLYITGYFPGRTLKYDSNSNWDNAKTQAYNPNNIETYLNPKYLGGLGSVGNIGKAFGCSVGSDGLLYIGGENVRSGSGGGMATYNSQTQENLGIKAGYENSDVRNVVTVGDYIVTSSFTGDKSTSVRVAVYNTDTNSIVRTIYPTLAKGAIYNNAGRLVADINGLPYVYMYTSNDVNTETRILKINVENGDVIFDRSYPYETSVGGYNDQGRTSLHMADDGFIYAYMGKYGKWLVRIDSITGDIEPIRVLTGNSSRFDIIGDDLYMGGSKLRKVSDIKVNYGF